MNATVFRYVFFASAAAFLTGSPINVALNRIEDSSNVVQARTNAQTTTVWDDQAWREQSLFTLLSSVNEHSDQETRDKARRFLENNPQWFIENMRTILSDKEQTESFFKLIGNNNRIILMVSDLLVEHFESYNSESCRWGGFMKTANCITNKLFIDTITVPLCKLLIPKNFSAVNSRLAFFVTYENLRPVIIDHIKDRLQSNKIDFSVYECIKRIIDEQPQVFIEDFIQKDHCHSLATINPTIGYDWSHQKYQSFWDLFITNNKGKRTVADFINTHFTTIAQFPDGVQFVFLFFGTIFSENAHHAFAKISHYLERQLSELSPDQAIPLLHAVIPFLKANIHLQETVKPLFTKLITTVSERIEQTDDVKLVFQPLINLTDFLTSTMSLDTYIEPLIFQHMEKIERYFNSSESSLEDCARLLRKLFKKQQRYSLKINLKPLTNAYLQKMIYSNQTDVSGRYCSPSIKHLAARGLQVFESQNKFISNQKLIAVMQQVSAKEHELNSQGYYTFVHGQRWSYQLVEEWFTKLWQITQSKQVENFIFTHVKPLSPYTAQQSHIRQTIVAHGRNDKLFNACAYRNLVLFMNAGLFYNTIQSGSNTAYYFFGNKNFNRHVQISLYDAFKIYGLESCYQQYEKELKRLATEHAQLSEHGNLLLIAIPQKSIDKCVYASWPDGYKKSVIINGIDQTSDIATILDTLRNDPEQIENFDYNEFCLIMTTDEHGGLNPESGIKFFQFNTVEPERWQAFKEKEQALFERIALDIEQHLARTSGLYLHS